MTTVKVFLTASETGSTRCARRRSPVDADAITPQQVQHVISLLASEFRYVIIDTGSGLDEGTLSVLKLCTDILLLTSTDVPSVRATRKEVEMLDLLGMTDQTRHFVVNRADARVGLPVSEVEATVGMEAEVTIPSSRAVPISVNQGTPVIVSDRRSNAGEAIGPAREPVRAHRQHRARLLPADADPNEGGPIVSLSDHLRAASAHRRPRTTSPELVRPRARPCGRPDRRR